MTDFTKLETSRYSDMRAHHDNKNSMALRNILGVFCILVFIGFFIDALILDYWNDFLNISGIIISFWCYLLYCWATKTLPIISVSKIIAVIFAFLVGFTALGIQITFWFK